MAATMIKMAARRDGGSHVDGWYHEANDADVAVVE